MHVRITTCKNITNTVIKLHAIYSRILVNLLVKLSRILVNLLVKQVELTRTSPMGAMGGLPPAKFQTPVWVRGIHLGPTPQRWACCCGKVVVDYETNETNETIARILLEYC